MILTLVFLDDLPPETVPLDAPARKTSIIWSPEIMQELTKWQRSGVTPILDSLLPEVPTIEGLSTEDARMLHYVYALS